jgi:hypothetical protein
VNVGQPENLFNNVKSEIGLSWHDSAIDLLYIVVRVIYNEPVLKRKVPLNDR